MEVFSICIVCLSPRLARSISFVVDSVCLSVTLLLQIDSSSLFIDGIEPFLAVVSPCGILQNVVLRFLI